MRPAVAAVQNYLAGWGPSTNASLADLYTFTLETGEILRYSGFQIALSAPMPDTTTPVNFFPLGPKFDRTHTRTAIGIEISQLEIDLYAGLLDELGFPGAGTITWQRALWAGLFDGAELALDRAILDWSAPDHPRVPEAGVVGTYNWFTGRVADVVIGRSKTVVKVNSLLDL